MVEYLDDALIRVTKVLDLNLDWEQREARIKHILLEKKGQNQENLFDITQQNSGQYPLLVGFCYVLGIGTVKDEEKAFEYWLKDTTSYGRYLVGRSYFDGLGVEIDLQKAFQWYQKSAEAGHSVAQCNLAYVTKMARESKSIYKRRFNGIKSLLKLVFQL